MSDLESKVINLCDAILKADTEHWDVKNRAVLQMTELFRSYQSEDLSVVNEAFTPEVFRALKEPVVQLVIFNICCVTSRINSFFFFLDRFATYDPSKFVILVPC
jgi:hypothetical protein